MKCGHQTSSEIGRMNIDDVLEIIESSIEDIEERPVLYDGDYEAIHALTHLRTAALKFREKHFSEEEHDPYRTP